MNSIIEGGAIPFAAVSGVFHKTFTTEDMEVHGVDLRLAFRMAQLDHISLQLALQRGAWGGDVGKRALLAVSDGAPRKVSQGISGETGKGAFAAAIAGRKREDNLGSCRFRGGSACG